ncbi:MAG: 2-dehydropantoate 2-reductase [Acidobacteria bacterium]|nr:2-dehydropantoate 2-reductase [Acidobacteriota bacterium]
MEMKPRTLAVIGAGPVGGILAAHLCAQGHTVILVDTWKEHIDRIRTHGLLVTDGDAMNARPAYLYDSIGALGEIVPDFVFICTKGCDLDSVLGEMSGGLKRSEAVFVSFQNGIDTEQVVANHIEGSRVLRAVVSYAGVLVAPGEIRKSFFSPPNYLGWLDPGGEESCREAAAILSGSGLATEATADIRRYVWRKTLFNTCTMAIAALTGMNMQEMVDFPPTADLIERLLGESIAVAAAHGFDYGPEFADTVRQFNRRAGPHRPSMSVDLQKGRKTENAFLVRRIAEYGEMKGVPVPLHRTMANLIDALEIKQRGLAPSFKF